MNMGTLYSATVHKQEPTIHEDFSNEFINVSYFYNQISY
jgi:hypothetical protein